MKKIPLNMHPSKDTNSTSLHNQVTISHTILPAEKNDFSTEIQKSKPNIGQFS
jgi:hypothetical protein